MKSFSTRASHTLVCFDDDASNQLFTRCGDYFASLAACDSISRRFSEKGISGDFPCELKDGNGSNKDALYSLIASYSRLISRT